MVPGKLRGQIGQSVEDGFQMGPQDARFGRVKVPGRFLRRQIGRLRQLHLDRMDTCDRLTITARGPTTLEAPI